MSLIVAIGAQNAYVLERGLARDHVLPVVVVCTLADAVLIALGVAGLGSLITQAPSLLTIVRFAGAAFLYVYALLALRRAVHPDRLDVRGGRSASARAAVGTVLGLTFLNPHVYLDTVVLLGSLAAALPTASARAAYAGGAMAASAVWFVGLGYGARLIAPVFRRPLAWRLLDLVIAAVMAALATGLVTGGR